MEPVVVIGPSARHLWKQWEGQKNEEPIQSIPTLCDRFSGGESYCQLQENVRGKDVYVVQSICAPANETLMDLLVIADAARRASAGRLTAVLPYMGYMRQDRKDKPRVPISAKLVVDMIECAGFERIITMDVHTLQAQGFTNIPFDHLFGFREIGSYIQARQKDDLNFWSPDVFVSPDIGATKRAQAYAEKFGVDFAIVNKKRSATNVKALSLIGDVKDKNVVIVDDLTETCNTLMEGARICWSHGAKSVRVAVTHCCLNQKGYANLNIALRDGLFSEFVTTNTVNAFQAVIDPKITVLPVTNLLVNVIRRTNENKSITELFDVKGF